MACARVPLDEQQVTEPGPYGKEHTLPALVRYCATCFNKELFTLNKITPVLLTKAFLLLIITPVLSAIKIAPSQEGGPLFCAL